MADSNTVILARGKTGTGLTVLAGRCVDISGVDEFSGTSVVVKPGLSFVFAAVATYNEDPGDVRPAFVVSQSGDEVVFTVATDKPVDFIIVGAD